MQSYKDPIINNLLANTKTKEDILTAIENLQKISIDINKDLSFSLTAHIIKYLSISPTQQDREIVTSIWNESEVKDLLKYEMQKNALGRELISKDFEPKLVFEMLMKEGTNKELKNFLKNNKNFFQENTKFKIFAYRFKKTLLCEKFGMKININIIENVIQYLTPMDKYLDVFNFIKSQKPKLSPLEWDESITCLLDSVRDCKTKGFEDIFIFINALNNPKNYSIEKIKRVSGNTEFIDIKNKELPTEELNNKWLHSVSKLNTASLVRSSVFNIFLNTKNDPVIEGIILDSLQKNIEKMITPKQDDPYSTFLNWPLSYYKKLLTHAPYRDFIFNYCYGNKNIKTNEQLFDGLKRHEKLDPYQLYITQELKSPVGDSFDRKVIRAILKANYNEDLYKKTKMLVKLELNLKSKIDTPRVKI